MYYRRIHLPIKVERRKIEAEDKFQVTDKFSDYQCRDDDYLGKIKGTAGVSDGNE